VYLYKINSVAFHSILLFLVIFFHNSYSFADSNHLQVGDKLHFSHPLISESPTPDTKIRFDYFFFDANGEEGEEEFEAEASGKFQEHTILLELEYAFSRNVSIVAHIPYTFLDVEDGTNENHFNNIEIGLKLASFIFEEYGILVGGGIEFGLPTGNNDKGIGSDNIIEIEPFLSFGYEVWNFEFVSFLKLGFPVNQNNDQDEGDEFGYNFSFLYHLNDSLQPILEFDGEVVLNGEEDGESVLNIDHGIKILPFKNKDIAFGFGAGFPLTNDEEFNYRLIGSIFYHFPRR